MSTDRIQSMVHVASKAHYQGNRGPEILFIVDPSSEYYEVEAALKKDTPPLSGIFGGSMIFPCSKRDFCLLVGATSVSARKANSSKDPQIVVAMDNTLRFFNRDGTPRTR